ncbi:hypothetical protein Save01_08742 [Streptomyces avermitilis]|uniref:Uncharacterized protein n=1 Tax=Streptomyces avermitilis TaxID=33903 RepID=A0A4D4MC88_STRAX|nr:hypothetical protein SAVMC3_07240 [Streptomyces avermitilis]GDY69540.1 hypothetical protein SAV14893_089330 [Streptomyces avermitilis]GDY79798.1 hypothetical protein SAV31267_092830 [Streptomyces avermitilis]
MPSMPLHFWNDPDGSRYHDAYFRAYPGVWRHGDWITLTSHGSVIVHGRSDATSTATACAWAAPTSPPHPPAAGCDEEPGVPVIVPLFSGLTMPLERRHPLGRAFTCVRQGDGTYRLQGPKIRTSRPKGLIMIKTSCVRLLPYEGARPCLQF